MELLAAAKPPSPLLPFQNHRKTHTSSSTAARRISSLSHKLSSSAQTAPLSSSIHFCAAKAASAPTNSLQEHTSTHKSAYSTVKSTTHLRIPSQDQNPTAKTALFDRIPGAHVVHSLKNHLSTLTDSPFLEKYLKLQLVQLSLVSVFSVPSPAFASETEEVSGKINIESIVVSIDDFFNRYPFFVAGVTFIWLVVIPLAEEYLKKYKYISAINAFRKLREDPKSQLLDIRKKQSRAYLESPNLKILSKSVIQVEFSEGQEENFVKEALKKFQDPSNTVVCVLDNFDGDSLKIAELLVKNGFKEAYAIKGGVRGKDGWQAIQETLLPPSVHIYPRKKKSSRKDDMDSERQDEHNGSNNNKPQVSSENPQSADNGQPKSMGAAPGTKYTSKGSLSPYPNYPDLKPPSSPTPSKPI
ncbi:hypothetical protein Taro_028004 [Colocasia esculenta]|uniref:Rhodanese domain-containing protein n=1 Tax=Colocasia esculenta TaxID=4460 RepID=A0A843VHB1_COLES|nr:hypothetical protein [Colocasia esculenta]